MLRIGFYLSRASFFGALILALNGFAADEPSPKKIEIPQPPPLPGVSTPQQPSAPRLVPPSRPTPLKPRPINGAQPLGVGGIPGPNPFGPQPSISDRPTPLAPPGYNASPIQALNAVPLLPPTSLAWDAETKEYKAKVGDTNAYFTFWLTNVCDKEVLVNSVRTSCGCTVAKMPETPWHIAPGTNGPINVTVDLRGKRGKVAKTVTVDTTAGIKSLIVNVDIPPDPEFEARMARSQNMQLALQDRQMVFRGDCATCHVEKSKGKMGQELYASACGICHEGEHRASMVPDLKTLKHPTNLEFWAMWIKDGKPGSLMPAFAQEHGGPLTPEQVTSLSNWLTENYKGQATAAAEPPKNVAQPKTSVQ
ncbi:MAG: DUF1573 domain-containing protein [Verrucomicrobia bacterium]|nr:DUF1573 domain-containing protein [Verrucomicrobiota bacterium]MBI3870758.1 DUF1573 domain-containing protein [Verrucomicrobiota bacterium]